MSADGRRTSRLRAARAAFAVLAAGVLWVALASTVSGEDPTAPAASASSSPGSSASPAATGSLFQSPAPEDEGPLASAPPLPTPIAHPDGGGVNGCYDCHDAVNDKQAEIAAAWQTSVHEPAGVGCADCHGGDPGSDQITVAMDPARGFAGVPDRPSTIGLCGSCHADVERMRASGLPTDQYAKYFASVHGQRLIRADDARVAICTDCHGSHDVKPVSDPNAKVFPLNVPALCADCHADAQRMEPYGIPTDQFDEYAGSVHGLSLIHI